MSKTKRPFRALQRFFTDDELQNEKSRLEAFLSAMPGDYCGFGHDGTIAFSQGFLDLLGLENVQYPTDILNAFDAQDAAAIENFLNSLINDHHAFEYHCLSTQSEKYIKISGTYGSALNQDDHFAIIWASDHSFEHNTMNRLETRIDEAEYDVFRFRSALDAMPLLSWIRDGQGDIIWVNKSYADALDTTKSDIIAKQTELPLSTNIASDINKHPIRALALSALDNDKTQNDKLHIILDGSRLLLSVQESPLVQGSGTLGLAQNITREEELETQQSRYLSANEELLQQLQSAIGIFSADQSLEFYNSAFAQLWNLEASWLNSRPRMSEILDKLRETRQLPEQADFRVYKQEWLSMFTSLIKPDENMLYLPNDKVLRMLTIPHPMGGLMITFEDVTSRFELESSYNTLIAVQKETLDNLSEAVIAFGGDGRVKLWNPSFRSVWGLFNEDLDGEPHVTRLVEKLKKYFDDASWLPIKEEFLALALDRSERAGRFERNDDTLLEYATVPLPDGGMLVTFFDVTDKVMVERALREKNQALQEAEKLKSDFLANVSYQLRTPLNTIMGFNDILTHEYFGPLNDKQKEYTDGILEASAKLRDLIDNILDLASFEAGQLTLDFQEFHIKSVMEQVHEVTSVWAQKEGIELTLKCPKSIGKMTADAQRLKQAILNLLRNSIAFTPKGGLITLQAKRKKNAIEFIIQDNGSGMTQDEAKRVFKPFERADTHHKQDGEKARGGVGLGLTLVSNIITLHNGTIDLETSPKQGTKVIIDIPIENQINA